MEADANAPRSAVQELPEIVGRQSREAQDGVKRSARQSPAPVHGNRHDSSIGAAQIVV
jgi:hypothetical protein